MKCFKYSNRPKAYITVVALDDAYGEETGKVVSVGCTLKADMQNPTWKVHVPIDLAESVGQELIRLARLDREKGLGKKDTVKIPAPRPALAFKPPEAPNKIQSEDVKSMSENAFEQGRVIKRQRKKN